jgi:N-acetyl sugar amidotransferase
MKYCNRCLYPENTKPLLTFDEQGLCAGCRYSEQKKNINYEERTENLKKIIEEYKFQSKKNGNIYDSIIPVSGGKDSTFQVYYAKEILGLNPLLVTYNHTFNTAIGLRNLENLLNKSNFDHIRFTTNRDSVRRLTKYFLKKIGDITWHYHAGITTFPFQIAVKYKIPLIIYGEEAFSEMMGMFNVEDLIEHTKMKRTEHSLRGFDYETMNFDDNSILKKDFAAFVYPSDSEIQSVGVRGIYLGNYIKWDFKKQTEEMIKKWGFEPLVDCRDRTFDMYSKTEDAANGVHDYLKYLKFGYGRATDDASIEIRNGRMTREEGINKVLIHDSKVPRDLEFILDFLDITFEEFHGYIDNMRDLKIWEKDNKGQWKTKSNVSEYKNPNIEKLRLPQKNIRTDYLKPISSKKKDIYNEFKIL